jgi:hypothetical protein
MGVLIDTSIWSLSLRRKRPVDSPVVTALQRLMLSQSINLLGLVRMELLSGVEDSKLLEELKGTLRNYPDLPLETEDYEVAAAFRTTCRKKGVQGSLADFLLCAAAVRREMQVFTIDRDFKHFATLLPIDLYLPHLIPN